MNVHHEGPQPLPHTTPSYTPPTEKTEITEENALKRSSELKLKMSQLAENRIEQTEKPKKIKTDASSSDSPLLQRGNTIEVQQNPPHVSLLQGQAESLPTPSPFIKTQQVSRRIIIQRTPVDPSLISHVVNEKIQQPPATPSANLSTVPRTHSSKTSSKVTGFFKSKKKERASLTKHPEINKEKEQVTLAQHPIEIKAHFSQASVQKALTALQTPSKESSLSEAEIKRATHIVTEIFNTEVSFYNQIQDISKALNFFHSDAVQSQLTEPERAAVEKLEQLGVYLRENKQHVENLCHQMESILQKNEGHLENTVLELAQLFASEEMENYLTFANNTAVFYQTIPGQEALYSDLIDKYGKGQPDVLSIGIQGQHVQLIALVQRPLKFDTFLKDLMQTLPKEAETASHLQTARNVIAGKSQRSNDASRYVSQPEIEKFAQHIQQINHDENFKELAHLLKKISKLNQKKKLNSKEQQQLHKLSLILSYLNAPTLSPKLTNEIQQYKDLNLTTLNELRSIVQQIQGVHRLTTTSSSLDLIITSHMKEIKSLYKQSGLKHLLSSFI